MMRIRLVFGVTFSFFQVRILGLIILLCILKTYSLKMANGQKASLVSLPIFKARLILSSLLETHLLWSILTQHCQNPASTWWNLSLSCKNKTIDVLEDIYVTSRQRGSFIRCCKGIHLKNRCLKARLVSFLWTLKRSGGLVLANNSRKPNRRVLTINDDVFPPTTHHFSALDMCSWASFIFWAAIVLIHNGDF